MFAFGHAAAADWRGCVEACAPSLGRPGAGLGFCYFTDALVDDATKIVDGLRSATGVDDWIGTVGTGVLATGVEYQIEPALVAMVAEVKDYAVFSGRAPLRRPADWAVVHADPSAPDVSGLVADMAAKVATGYLVGGLSSSRSRTVQVANEVVSGGLSGAAFGSSVAVATRLTQGCVPISPRLRVTRAEENIIATLDGRPALEVLQEILAGRRLQVLVGLPVPGSDTGDYTARNLIGADPKNGLIAIGDTVEMGAEILFCKRDSEAARQDLGRIAGELAAQAPRPRGALYFSCVARGEHMFGDRGAEVEIIRRALAQSSSEPLPLVGFFCNGEISSDRLYGYTGVLTVFP